TLALGNVGDDLLYLGSSTTDISEADTSEVEKIHMADNSRVRMSQAQSTRIASGSGLTVVFSEALSGPYDWLTYIVDEFELAAGENTATTGKDGQRINARNLGPTDNLNLTSNYSGTYV